MISNLKRKKFEISTTIFAILIGIATGITIAKITGTPIENNTLSNMCM